MLGRRATIIGDGVTAGPRTRGPLGDVCRHAVERTGFRARTWVASKRQDARDGFEREVSLARELSGCALIGLKAVARPRHRSSPSSPRVWWWEHGRPTS